MSTSSVISPFTSMEFSISLQLLLLSLSIIFIYFYYKPTTSKNINKTATKIYTLFGILPELMKNSHRFLEWATEKILSSPTNTVVLRLPGGLQGVMTANPSCVEHILKENFENYPKGDVFNTYFLDFFGGGLFTSDGEVWKVNRKVANHALNTKSYRNFMMDNVALELETKLVPLLETLSKTGEVFDFEHVLERFGFDNVFKVAFGFELGCLEGEGSVMGYEFLRAYEDATKISTLRCMYPSFWWKTKRFLNIGSEKRLKKATVTLQGFVDNIVQTRIKESKKSTKQNKDRTPDLLDRLMAMHDNEGNYYSAEFHRNMTIGVILAAQDTTVSALTWFFWLLATRPEIQTNILKELESIRARREPENRQKFAYTYEEIRDMQYLHAAISESMRLYPPAPTTSRSCSGDDVFPDGTFVEKGSVVIYNAYAMARMEKLWGENCCEFRPERWLGQDDISGGLVFKPENPYKYPIFNGGPRMCVGIDIGYIQMKYIAASLIERFEISLEDKERVPQISFWFTIGMKGGLPVTIQPRKTTT
ncbi:cytochrome P450 CYP94D108-like [Cannabis sativa]|uniref:cytochrome P450 CYP94D108-like n=1 Tax=Cannabis sativa TaxID=3483 RepID=UPI0029CAA405|nr:cytochrome P450 CYP94D108-like [Cannabis sativa]